MHCKASQVAQTESQHIYIYSFHNHNIQTAGSSRARLSSRNPQVLFKAAPGMLVPVFQAVIVEYT